MSNEEKSIVNDPKASSLKEDSKFGSVAESVDAAPLAEVSEEAGAAEEIVEVAEAEETAEVAEIEAIAEATETVADADDDEPIEVSFLRDHNNAVAYLRRQDCEMLTTLRDHLGENIRLHNILAGINAEIARLKKLLKTPKPKIKSALLIIGLVLIGAGLLVSMIQNSGVESTGNYTTLYALGGIGAILITIAIVLKVLANKKWQAFIDETTEELKRAEERARIAQQNIDEYWENHALPFIASIIPDRFPVAHVLEYNTVCGMLYVMDNLRADTIKEAINLYDELCFRSSMRASFQNMESSLYETARNSARYAAAAERSAAANERAAASAALTAASAASIASSAASASNAIRDMANKT